MLPLLQTNGTAAKRLFLLYKAKPLKWAKIDRRTQGKKPTHLIIGIGQIHPVLRGRFEAFQARRIANIQAWIFHLCRYLADQEGVLCFGKEGFGSADGKPVIAKLALPHIKELQSALHRTGSPERLLRVSATDWRRSLHRRDANGIRHAIRSLDALSVLQAINERVTIFPLERTMVHAAIHTKIDDVQKRIGNIEHSQVFLSGKSKGGKALSRQEVNAFLERNDLVRSFNNLLTDPERDRSIFDAVLSRSLQSEVTAFVLGQGHRQSMLSLARKHLPADTIFIWITPPQLWLWRAVLQWLGWTLLSCALATLALLGLR